MLTYYESSPTSYQMLRSSPHKDCSYSGPRRTPSSGTPAVTEEVVEVLDLLEVEEVGEVVEGRPRPRRVATTRDLMLPRPEHLEEIETWTDASSGNRKREIKVDTAIPCGRRATCPCLN